MIIQCFADSGRALYVGDNVDGTLPLTGEAREGPGQGYIAHPPESAPENLSRRKGRFKTTGGGSLHL